MLNFQILWFCVSSILHVWFRSKTDCRKLSCLLIGSTLTELTFLKKMRIFSREFNDHWKCKEQKILRKSWS